MGYSCVGLNFPKYSRNVGAVTRLAGNFGVNSVFYTGCRFKRDRNFRSDTTKSFRHIPLVHVDDLLKVVPYDCSIVVVDCFRSAISLCDFVHPDRAFYLFGSEDATLGFDFLRAADSVVYIPSNRCLNLSNAVSIVLYDRFFKGVVNEKRLNFKTN